MTNRKNRLRRLAGLAPAVVALCIVVAGCAGTRRATVQSPDATHAGSGVYHVVQPGQTIWRIATVYGIPVDELARANGIEDASLVLSGQTLYIPGATALLEVPPYPAPLDEPLAGTPPRGAVTAEIAFDWPVRGGRIVSTYGAHRRAYRHKGLDIGTEHGQPVLAARAGRVVYSGSTLRGYGKTVIVDHGDRFSSLYAHNSALLVREGEWVEKGQTIARVGRTGNASGEHCHFEIRKDEVPVDPLAYLPSSTGAVR